MSIYAEDVLSFTSVLKMSYNFLSGRDYLKKRKTRERKKIISVALGFPDLVFAANAIPVFPIRMESFKINTLLIALNSATSVLGWDLTSKVLDIVKKFDVLKVVDKILDDVVSSVNDKYNQMYDLGSENGIPSDLCYGVNALYGMHKSVGTQIDGNLNFAMRCGEWNKYSESLKSLVPNQVWIDLPQKEMEDEKNAVQIMRNNIQNAIKKLESITGNYVSDESLRKQFRIGNQVKRFYKTILHEICPGDFYPCNPAVFSEILALLTISFQDYNSNAQRYLENLSQLVKEMRERVKKGIGMDVSNRPRLLFSPMFTGWEPEIHEIVSELGGILIYADWELLGLLEEIPVSNNSDPIEDYAHFLLRASNEGIGCNIDNLKKSYFKIAKEMQIDGLIFNQAFGCPAISNIYDSLKEEIKEDLSIPAVGITFRKIGDNVEEVKNRLKPFMDMFNQ